MKRLITAYSAIISLFIAGQLIGQDMEDTITVTSTIFARPRLLAYAKVCLSSWRRVVVLVVASRESLPKLASPCQRQPTSAGFDAIQRPALACNTAEGRYCLAPRMRPSA